MRIQWWLFVNPHSVLAVGESEQENYLQVFWLNRSSNVSTWYETSFSRFHFPWYQQNLIMLGLFICLTKYVLMWHFGDLAKILVTKFCQGKMSRHFVLWHFRDFDKIWVTKFCQGKMSRHFVPWHFLDLENSWLEKICPSLRESLHRWRYLQAELSSQTFA